MRAPYIRFKVKRFIYRIVQRFSDFPQEISTFFKANLIGGSKSKRQNRRFVMAWASVAVIIVASVIIQAQFDRQSVLVEVPANGGTYREALVGELDNFNPIYAVDGANADISRLVFAGLLAVNTEGDYVGRLANSWEANTDATEFSVVLKDDVRWHDGERFTSADVVKTIELIQNEASNSPLKDSWSGVEVEAVDDVTVKFRLPNSFAPFPSLLTVGILPEHQVSNIEPAQLRVSDFNTTPVGTGPFKLSEFDEENQIVTLTSFRDYFVGSPKIDRMVIRAYEAASDAVQTLERKEVDAYGTLDGSLELLDQQPTKYKERIKRLASGAYLFFKTDDQLLKDRQLRQALTRALSPQRLVEQPGLGVLPIFGPFLESQLSTSANVDQLAHNQEQARELLDKLGWKPVNDKAFREKDGQPLQFAIKIAETNRQKLVAQAIQRQLAEVGVDVVIQTVVSEDYQSQVVLPHDYQAAIISVQNGVEPDVYVYWHSSQAKPGGLNFSNLKNSDIDSQLEAGRTRVDEELRVAKYERFAELWRAQAPAVGLFQETYHFNLRSRVSGVNDAVIIRPSDRYFNVHQWTVLSEAITFDELRSRNNQ